MFKIIGGDGKEYGPVACEQINRWLSEGRATLQTRARREGEALWHDLGSFPEFAPKNLEVSPEAPSPSFISTANTEDKDPAAALRAYLAPRLEAQGPRLASRWVRLVATVLDNILAMLFALPGFVLIGVQVLNNGGQMPGPETEEIMPFLPGFLTALAGFGLIGLAQIVLLSLRAQTIGKLLMGIHIVKIEDDSRAGFFHAFLLRAFVPGFLGNIPYLGLLFMIVDACFIFRADRRCLHDLIASTRVVDKN